MNKFIEELTNKVYELYKTYEIFCWDKESRKLVIVLEKNNILSFYLFENDELLDDVHISFGDSEYILYQALSVRLFVKVLGNVKIHKLDRDMYYNAKHKRYLLFIVKNQELQKLIENITSKQEEEIINLETNIVRDASKLVKRKHYDKQFLNEIDKRTKLISEILRRW